MLTFEAKSEINRKAKTETWKRKRAEQGIPEPSVYDVILRRRRNERYRLKQRMLKQQARKHRKNERELYT